MNSKKLLRWLRKQAPHGVCSFLVRLFSISLWVIYVLFSLIDQCSRMRVSLPWLNVESTNVLTFLSGSNFWFIVMGSSRKYSKYLQPPRRHSRTQESSVSSVSVQDSSRDEQKSGERATSPTPAIVDGCQQCTDSQLFRILLLLISWPETRFLRINFDCTVNLLLAILNGHPLSLDKFWKVIYY